MHNDLRGVTPEVRAVSAPGAVRRRMTWRIAIILAVLAVLIWLWFTIRDTRLANGRLSAAGGSSQSANPVQVKAGVTGDSRGEGERAAPKNSNSGQGFFRLGAYDKYLDQICPRLTAAEEDKLIADSGGDPSVYLGLAFTGSTRSAQWLKEALKKAPDEPLVHYAILCKSYEGFDRLHSALELARLMPQDAAPLHAAALELLKKGDREGAVAKLREAAGREQFSMLSGSARDSAVAVYSLANRSADDARARVLLQGTSRFEGVTALRLGEQLGLVIGGSVSDVGGKEEAAALMLDVYEKGVYSQGLDLHSYRESRGSELSYLKAFLSVGANAADRSNIEKYFGSPLSQMYGQAKTEWDEVSDVLLFSADKPGIYQRLNPDEQSELINRIAKDGEVSAYLWAYRTRRDIFRSPDFVPQGMPPDGWKMLIKNPGRIPIQ